jgi:hypothetical protein
MASQEVFTTLYKDSLNTAVLPSMEKVSDKVRKKCLIILESRQIFFFFKKWSETFRETVSQRTIYVMLVT